MLLNIPFNTKRNIWLLCLCVIISCIFFIKEENNVSNTIEDAINALTHNISNTNIRIPATKTPTMDIEILNTTDMNIPFNLTCTSFKQICNNLSTSINIKFAHITIEQFNTKCKHIKQFIVENAPLLSPLFILSFRREFILNKYYKYIAPNCLKMLAIAFKMLHSKALSFHHIKEAVLYHTHISKAAGSANHNSIINIMQQLTNHKYINYKYKILNRGVKGYARGFVICGGPDCGSFPSCKQYYSDLLKEEGDNERIVRMADERPLSNRKICPQFYNSIIIREPISHRLSFLAFMNRFNPSKKALYYVTNKNNFEQHMCLHSNEMKGVLNELFQDNNTGYSMDALRKQSRQNKGGYVYEWINPNERKFVIGVRQAKRSKNNKVALSRENVTKCVHREFNTTYLMGWLSNTYARWIGYDHPNEDTVLDSLFIDYVQINEDFNYLLWNTKRLLIQYDYVLPLDTEQYTIQHPIYQYYAKDIQNKIFNITQVNDFYISNLSVAAYNYKKAQFGISTHGLFTVFNESQELDLLVSLNQIDLKIFEFSKNIAMADILFNEWLRFEE